MTVRRHDVEIPRLTEGQLAEWRDIPAAVTSDAMGRTGTMIGAISPLDPKMRITAQARTVACMVADNSALHAAIGLAQPGEVLVCDAQGFEDAAIWGGLMTLSAIDRKLAGLVIDGAVRDSAEIVEARFPTFARAVVPRGPHKGFGGVIDGIITCGGRVVAPGDLIIGDADGVTVVPFADIPATLKGARAILDKEAMALDLVAKGGSLADVYGVPEVEVIPQPK
ncbi:RraA family protein [Rhodobacteraceae bacterium NNCM2]|nr:RraA family protein [Coraliihabitans acroporae]